MKEYKELRGAARRSGDATSSCHWEPVSGLGQPSSSIATFTSRGWPDTDSAYCFVLGDSRLVHQPLQLQGA